MARKFRNDYSELAHENVLKALLNAINDQHGTYGLDDHSENAKKLIKETFKLTNSEIHFVSGGTQANLLVISYFLRPYEGVICCDSGHINVHETAAVEATGHKIYVTPSVNGKILKEDVLKALRLNNNEHTVKLKMVYISNSTETGTIYNKKELEELYQVCKENNLLLFIDGARLASALTSKDNDIKVEDFAKLCDVFYIGGTKNGLLSGEAIVINNVNEETYFRHHIKNKGAMLAKGFVLGIQFEEIFKNNLYFDLAKKANEMADYIKENLSKRFKENEALKSQLEDAKEILFSLSGRYSIEPGDMESLKSAVNADDELFQKEAEKQGLDVKNYRYLKNLERENEAYRKFFEKERLEREAADTMRQWYDMSEALAKEYPDFNISKEAENPKFIALIKAGVDLKTAYEAIHHKDILDLAKEDAASKARKEATREYLSREARPEENGLSARSSAIIKTDVSKLSAKDRAELAKRAAKGEKISF